MLPRFYSLLYLDERNLSNVNLRTSGDQVEVYLKCAQTLSRSIDFFGGYYELITNSPREIRLILARIGGGVRVGSINFTRRVPEDAPFYSAHFKLDLLRHLGTGRLGSFVCLVDVDMVLIRPFDIKPDEISEEALFVYDIGEYERASFGREVERSLDTLGAPHQGPECHWYGGEFVMGSAKAFDTLSAGVDQIWPRYRHFYSSLHHTGDEVVTTAALECLRANGTLSLINVANGSAGAKLDLVSRWWTARTLYEQKPFDAAQSAAMLHLPSDKLFLASMAGSEFRPSAFLSDYRLYAARRLAARKLFSPILNMARREKRIVARLTGR